MEKKQDVVALIPARGGSKGLPGKNVRFLGGYPLIAWSIIACRLCPTIKRTIVTTDSPDIANWATRFGAEVPFLRPAEIAQDNSPDRDFVTHALDWFKEQEGFEPNYLVHIRPTTPLRDPSILANAIERIQNDRSATGLRSVHELAESPYKMFQMQKGYLAGLFPNDPRLEYYNLPRQSFPAVYHPNGYVDIIKSMTVRQGPSLHGSTIMGFETPPVIEIDRPEDFDLLDLMVEKKGHILLDQLRLSKTEVIS